ncbi:MAG: alpha/beta fold hydrolase, partial [Parasporobacterium sp.]|nr:alpha/beta fold hydrolase [Parasporobacterium sp.]
SRTKVAKDDPENKEEYSSSDDNDKVGMILSKNYVLVSYGCRARNDDPVDGIYNGHSPATVADTKAVIRYLRYNKEALPAGNTDCIIITGTSGGGALSCVIGASGDSSDFFPYLYEIGAAGVEKEGEDYTSSISDSVAGVIAYCPITDLPNADAAYEWTYAATRKELEGIDFNTNPEKKAKIYYSEEEGTINEEVSSVLTGYYEEYVDQLGLKLDDGTELTSANLKDAIIGLMETEITESMQEIGTEQMLTDIGTNANGKESVGPQDWLVFDDNGDFTYDFDQHLNWVASNTKLKVVCAFSNAGLPWAATNEDSLFGAGEYPYAAFEAYSWEHDSVAENGSGLDDTGLDWNAFLETPEGQQQLLQMRMTNAIEYLNDTEGDDAGVKAPFWYVRYGMNDRDSSFAVETILRYSITNNADIRNADFEFAWLKPHSGDYDVTEAYAWLDSVLAGETADAEPEAASAEAATFTSEELILKNGDQDIYGILYLPGQEQENYPAVIISHGFGGNYRVGQSMAESFAENGYAVYVYDFIGGGTASQSGAADGDMSHMSVLTEASDLSAVMDQIRELPCIAADHLFLLGQSQGGYVSAYVAAQRPEDVCALILQFPAFALQDDCWERHGSIENVPETEQFMGQTLGAVYSVDAMSMDIYEIIGNYKGDVLICHGDNDKLVDLSYSERAAEVYENAQLHIYEGAGHGFTKENAERFIEESLEFLQAHAE